MKDDFLFSKELRDKLEQFGNMDVGEAIASPQFFEVLFEHAGIDKKAQNEIWEKVGRPDLKRD